MFRPTYMFRLIGGEAAGLHPQQIAVHDVIERSSQTAVVVVLQCHKAERLQYRVLHLSHWTENFGHAVHRAGLRLKGNLDKVALSEAMRQLEQAAGCGNGLEFRFGAPAIFKSDRSQDRIA